MATLLVVDDEFGIAELFEAILADEGHRVLTAMNGKQGLEILDSEDVSLVFMDYMMPIMNGGSMLAAMLADPKKSRIPVVMMSSMPEATIRERCSGYARFLRKPFKLAEVILIAQSLNGPVK